jgi:hypothetical protein
MFRFTNRELVLLTLVVAMGVGWWLDRTRLAESLAYARALEAIANANLQMRMDTHDLGPP